MLIPSNGFRIPSAEQLSRPFSAAAAGLPGGFSPAAARCYLSPARPRVRANPWSSLSCRSRSRSADWRLITAAIEGLFVRSALNPLIL